MSEDFESERSRLDWRLDDLTRDYPLDRMTARRFGAACVRRIPSLLPPEVAAAVAAWEEEAAGVSGPAAAVDPDAWAAEGEVGGAGLAAARAVWAGDARAAAAETVRALSLCLQEFLERAIRPALNNLRYPHMYYGRRGHLEDEWEPFWIEAWNSPPAGLTAAHRDELEAGFDDLLYADLRRGFGDGERWMEWEDKYKLMLPKLIECARRNVAKFYEREHDRQCDILDELLRDGAEMEHSKRKMRLYAAARARSVWHLLADESRRAVEVTERFADGVASGAELAKAYSAAGDDTDDARDAFEKDPTDDNLCAFQAAVLAEYAAQYDEDPRITSDQDAEVFKDIRITVCEPADWIPVERDEARAKACWQRAGIADIAWLDEEMFGDPARPVAFNPVWATETVLALARSMYLDHAFDAMPILADALQDSGCEDAAILDHCRRGGPHARGCWVLDLILRKR